MRSFEEEDVFIIFLRIILQNKINRLILARNHGQYLLKRKSYLLDNLISKPFKIHFH